MVKVPTLASNLLMGALQELMALRRAGTALLATADTALGALQDFFRFAVVAWVGNLLPTRQRQEGFQPHINARLFARQGQGLHRHIGTGRSSIPAIRLFG